MPNTPNARQVLAKNIRRKREKLAISQEELGELAELHRTYIGSIERAERNVSVDNIERIAQALHVRIIDLFQE